MKNSFWIVIVLIAVNINSWGQCSGYTNCFIVTNTLDDANTGSLRWAINQVNLFPNGSKIAFNILGTGVKTIILSTSLPNITKGTFIDGTSQPGYNTITKEPLIAVTTLSNLTSCFSFGNPGVVDNIEVKGMKIYNFIQALRVGGNNFAITDNVIYNSIECVVSWGDNGIIKGCLFGADRIGGVLEYKNSGNNFVRLYGENNVVGAVNSINEFYNGDDAISISGGCGLPGNNNSLVHFGVFIGNSKNINLFGYHPCDVIGNKNHPAPIFMVAANIISGTALPGDVVRVYTSDITGTDAVCLIGTATADSQGNWSLVIPEGTCGVDFSLINRFSATATDPNLNTSEFSTNKICEITFNGLPDYVCYSTTPIPLTSSGGGTFTGLGIVGNTFVPSTEGVPGTYQTITYTENTDPTCFTSKKILVARKPVYADRVLSTSAVTFSDSWPITSDNSASSTALKGLNDFQNGTRGVWRAESSFAYEDKSGNIDPLNTQIRTQGVLSDVELFDHSSGANGECNVNWRKVNTVTHYNMASSETENRDILGLYSSALFGYDGRLAAAVAANAASNEICYEGFEEYPVTTSTTHVTPSNLDMGNFSFFTNTVQASDFPTRSLEFEIIRAQDNVLTVNCPFAESGKYFTATAQIKIFGAGLVTYNEKIINGSYPIQSITAVAGDASKCLITLSSASFTVSDVWKGKIALKQNVAALNPEVVLPGNVSVQANNTLIKAHTGKQYLKQSTGQVMFEQTNMTITPGDKLIFSAWIRMDNNDRSTYDITTPQGRWRAGLFFYTHDKTALTNVKIRSAGNIIEGWQKVEGEAVVPANATRLVIGLNSDANPVYWDDIRIFPSDGQMQSYVYRDDYKLAAVLDNNNYASFYYYDEEGGLYLTKKETERGVMTISETFTHTQE